MTDRIDLDALTFDVSIWPRVARDDARVAQLADMLRAGQDPPIKVQSGTTLVLGGWHTAAACRVIGESSYFVEPVDVAPGDRLLFAYHEDVAAALPYSDADVRSVARRLYEQRCGVNGDMPNVSTLARDLGRSQQTVARWLNDLVEARQVKRQARVLAIHAFRATNLSLRRIEALIGISHQQVVRDTQVSIADHLLDSRIVTEAHSLIHLAIGTGATTAEMEAARDWLIAKTNPAYLEQRERRRVLTTLTTEFHDCAERWKAIVLPEGSDWTECETVRADTLRALEELERYVGGLKERLYET